MGEFPISVSPVPGDAEGDGVEGGVQWQCLARCLVGWFGLAVLGWFTDPPLAPGEGEGGTRGAQPRGTAVGGGGGTRFLPVPSVWAQCPSPRRSRRRGQKTRLT